MAPIYSAVRRASSCSSSALHLRNCLSACRFLPFSTSSALTSAPDIGDKIENEIASYSNEVAAVPGGFPFEIKPLIGYEATSMERRYQNERITVRAESGVANPDNGDSPFIPVTVNVDKGKFNVTSYMNIKPDQLEIENVIISNWGTDHMEDYEEYFRSRGITPKAISFMYDCLGFSKKNA